MPDVFDDAVDLMRALASGPRLKIMCSLLDGPQNVTEICERLNMSQSGVSQHLGRLRTQGLVVASRRGQFVNYALPENVTRDVIAFLDMKYAVRSVDDVIGAKGSQRKSQGHGLGQGIGQGIGKSQDNGAIRMAPRHAVPLLA
ncbi:MAG: metalloregulator ArsR/SmtB family transcription factor [Hyphomicrobium sp.]